MAAGVNNAVYATLGARWYEATDDPIALLRAESALRNPWILESLAAQGPAPRDVLDVGCGAGFVANTLALAGHRVTGLDREPAALAVARDHDRTGTVEYLAGDATRLPFPDGRFDAVCAMDFLEHVDAWPDVVREAARVLRPRGLFFFHTFDRSWRAWLVVIKGVEWVVRNTPPALHLWKNFIRPVELERACEQAGLVVSELRGVAPRVWSRAFVHLLRTGEVRDLQFRFTRSLRMGYSGVAVRT